MTEALEIQIELDCPADHAFATWTQSISTWWPPSHTITGDPDEVVLEPRVGGRIFERTPDGAEHDWGEITNWEPPLRLGYLWHLRSDRADATDVELTFVPLSGQRCRLEIVHSGWERLGARADVWRDANRGGWSGLLPHFVELAMLQTPSFEKGTTA